MNLDVDTVMRYAIDLISFNIKINKHNFSNEKNKISIEYLLESNEHPIKIEIEMSDINA